MAHLTVAANERAFNKLVDRIRETFHVVKSDSGSFGPFTVSYSAGIRLGSGSIDLQSDGTVRLDEMDVIYDPLEVTFGIDIPTQTIGGFCIIPSPWGCVLRAPRISFFTGNPDVSVPIDFSGLFQSEVSGAFKLIPKYFSNPAKGLFSDHDAHDLNVANQWQFFLDPIWIDIDIVDIAGTIGNILDAVVDSIIDSILGFLPGWAKKILKAFLSPIINAIEAALDLPDDIQEWLSNLLGTSLGLLNFITTAVAQYFADQSPLFSFEDPLKILEGSGPLIPVLIPIKNLTVAVNDVEMVLSSDIG